MRSAAATLLLFLALTACDAEGSDGAAARPPIEQPLTLRYAVTNRAGGRTTEAARALLGSVLPVRLERLGHANARIEFPKPGELLVTVEESASAAVDAEVQRNIDFVMRPRLRAEIENAEAEKRKVLGDQYLQPDEPMAWVPLHEGAEDMLVVIAEKPFEETLQMLSEAPETDEEALTNAKRALHDTLMQEVFRGGDLSDSRAVHQTGGSAVFVRLRKARHEAFRRFSEHYRNRPLAMIVNGAVVAAPPLLDPIENGELIFTRAGGGFSPDEAEGLAEALRRVAFGTQLTRLE